jgi:hypothetical protein
MTNKVTYKDETIPVKTEKEREEFWNFYGEYFAYMHKKRTETTESDWLQGITDWHMNWREASVYPTTNQDVLNNIINHISEEELLMITEAWFKKVGRSFTH